MSTGTSQWTPEFTKGARDVINETFDARNGGDDDSYFYTLVPSDDGWYLILCSDLIRFDPNEWDTLQADFNAVSGRIINNTVTFDDLSNPIYKLYKIIQNEQGSNDYNNSLSDFVNSYYKENYVTIRKDRIQDLYNLG